MRNRTFALILSLILAAPIVALVWHNVTTQGARDAACVERFERTGSVTPYCMPALRDAGIR